MTSGHRWCFTALLLASAGVPLAPVDAEAAPDRALLAKYCLTCHNERARVGGLSLEKIELDRPTGAMAETLEKVVGKLRGGMMPPAGMPRPPAPVLDGF